MLDGQLGHGINWTLHYALIPSQPLWTTTRDCGFSQSRHLPPPLSAAYLLSHTCSTSAEQPPPCVLAITELFAQIHKLCNCI